MIARYRMFVLKLVITGLVLFLLFSAVDLKTVGAHLADISLGTFAIAALGYVLATVVSTFRWSILLKVRGVHVPMHRLLGYNFSYLFYSLVLPGGKVAAEAMRVYQIVRDTNDPLVREKVIFPTLLDRAVAVCTYAVAALAVFLFMGKNILAELPFWFPYAIAGIVLLIVFSVFLPVERLLRPFTGTSVTTKAHSTLNSLTEAVAVYRSFPLHLAVAVALSLIMLACMSGASFVIAEELGFPVPFILLLGVFSISMIAAFLPLTIAGVGVREGVFAYLLAAITNVPLEVALSISLLALISSHVVTLLGGLVEFHRHFMRSHV
jgi:hypothetical protein